MTDSERTDSHILRPVHVPPHVLDALAATAPDAVLAALREGDAVGALRAAVDVRDLDAAVDVVRVGWFELTHDVQRDASREILDTLHAGELRAHPLLAMQLGVLYNGDGLRRAKAAHYFGVASFGVRAGAGRGRPVDRALIFAGESTALRLIGRASLSVRSARAGVRALAELPHDATGYIGNLPRVYHQLGISLYYAGEEAEALAVFARGYAEAGTSDRASFGSLSMMAGIHALDGNLNEAGDLVMLARGEPWTDEQRSMYTGTFYRLAEAILALERFAPAEAEQHLGVMEHDRRSIEHWFAIARVEATAALAAGDPARGLAELEAFVALRGPEGATASARRHLSSVRSLLHLALGNYDAAAAILQRDAGSRPQDHVDRARLALVEGRTSEALRQLRQIAGSPQSARTRAEALSIETAIALRAGEGPRTANVLGQLVSVLRRTHQRLALLLLPQEDFELVRRALDRAGHADLLEDDRSRSVLAPREPSPLTARESAVLQALVHTASHKEIAAELFISTNTVKTHIKSLYRKLGAGGREEALTIAMHRHLLTSVDAP